MSNNKKVEKKECPKCLHYEMCLDNFRKAKEEGLWELTDEKEYFAHADECDFCAVGYCKQKTARWILEPSWDIRVVDTFMCSNCGHKICVPTRYCSSCGSRMDGRNRVTIAPNAERR